MPPLPPKKFSPKDVLLPRTDAPSVLSSARRPAGELYAQEQKASIAPPPKPRATPAPKPKDESEVQPLQTYQGDIQKMIQTQNVSSVSIAAAESNRRARTPEVVETKEVSQEAQGGAGPNTATLLTIVGALLVVLSLGAAGYVAYLRSAPAQPAQQTLATPFITVDGTNAVTLSTNEVARADTIRSLTATKTSLKIPLSLVAQLTPVVAGTSTVSQPMGVQAFLQILAPHMPPALSRSFDAPFLFGVHGYAGGNEPFLILETHAYEQTYSGMLAWEPFMRDDLLPLFAYTPSPRPATDTAATSTLAIVQSGFTDAIIQNHDARAIENAAGDPQLLWTFIDKNTLVITTNQYTLGEVISRYTGAPAIAQ